MDKKQEILDAAYMLFSEKGYSLSMSEISQAVHIKTPSLYSHFKSKDEIIELTVKAEIERYFNMLFEKTAALANLSCEKKLRCLFFLVIEYYNDNRRLRFWHHISLLQQKQLQSMRGLIKSHNTFLVDAVRSCFQKGVAQKEIRENITEGALYLYFSMLQGFLDIMQFHLDDEILIENQAAMVWAAYWNGIKLTQ